MKFVVSRTRPQFCWKILSNDICPNSIVKAMRWTMTRKNAIRRVPAVLVKRALIITLAVIAVLSLADSIYWSLRNTNIQFPFNDKVMLSINRSEERYHGDGHIGVSSLFVCSPFVVSGWCFNDASVITGVICFSVGFFFLSHNYCKSKVNMTVFFGVDGNVGILCTCCRLEVSKYQSVFVRFYFRIPACS